MPRAANPKPNKYGKVQIAADVDEGLFNAIKVVMAREGLPLSALVRRSVMHELDVDASGQPFAVADLASAPATIPMSPCVMCKELKPFYELECNAGICDECITVANG